MVIYSPWQRLFIQQKEWLSRKIDLRVFYMSQDFWKKYIIT
jgi:hypothetical protein